MAQNRYYSSLVKPTVTTVDPGAAGTTLTVADTSSYSVLDSTFPYTLAINWGLGDQEFVSCTARPSGTTFTVTRGVGGTTAVPHAIGATVFLSVYDADLTEAASHRGSNGTPTTTGVHGVTGAVVGTSDTQTLSNKTVLQGVASYSANHTATATDNFMLVSAASGNVTITLPTAVGVTGQTYLVKRTDTTYANTITVATTSSQTIDGATTYTSLWAQYSYVQVVSDGSNWQIVDSSTIAEPWQSISYAAQWADNGSPNQAGQYRRTVDGAVELRGRVQFTSNGTTGLNAGSGSTMVTLPAAYRPASTQGWPLPVYGSPTISSNRIPSLVVSAAGLVTMFNVSSVTTNGTVVSMDINGMFWP